MMNGYRIATIHDTAEGQVVVLPGDMRFNATSVAVRRDGQAVILEPIKPRQWPTGFFECIRIDDAAFCRPEQGELPAAPTW